MWNNGNSGLVLIKYHYFSCDFNSYVYGNIKHKSLAVTESYVMRVLRVCLSHGPLFRADSACSPLIGQFPPSRPSHWSQSPWHQWPGLLHRGTGDDMAICHDSYDGLMRVTVLSRGWGSDQWEASMRSVDQWEARIKRIDQWEAGFVSPRVYCNDNWGHIKRDGDFLADNECIVISHYWNINTKQIATHIIFKVLFDAFVWLYCWHKKLSF